MSDSQENATLNEGTGDQEFTVGTSGNNLMTNENTMKVKTLERGFIEKIASEISNIGDRVESRIQNAILTSLGSVNAPKTE